MKPNEIKYEPIVQEKKPFYFTQVERHEFAGGGILSLIPVVLILIFTVVLAVVLGA